jgi:prophage regulatory protein
MQRILRCPEVVKTVGLSRSRIYDLIKRGEFPPPFPLGKRAVGWSSTAVERWVEEKVAAGEQQPAAAE